MQKRENVEILFFEVDFLLFEVVVDHFLLLLNWLTTTVNFLKDDLHKVGLALSQKLHFLDRLFINFS